jgi:hypothetical protein
LAEVTAQLKTIVEGAEVGEQAVDADQEPDDRPVHNALELVHVCTSRSIPRTLSEMFVIWCCMLRNAAIVAGWAESRYHSSGWAWAS